MKINITKAELKGYHGLSYNYTTKTDDDFEQKISTKSDAPPHQDLMDKYRLLAPHLAFICEYITEDECDCFINNLQGFYPKNGNVVDYDENLEKLLDTYAVESFEITGKGDKESVKISGIKFLPSLRKSISLTTPTIKYSNDDYPFIDNLIEVVQDLRDEVFQYYNGKQAPDNQIEMEFE